MPQYFIDRPIFAWVIAIFIVLAGSIALPRLPVARYPVVAPPTVTITATYPGATPQTMNDAVVGLLEREISSVKHVLYFEASVDTSGAATITVTFKPGTDPELAQVDVQNRLKAIESRLPQVVRQNGLSVDAAGSSFLLLVGLTSTSDAYDGTALSDYMARHVVDELRRIEGVGRVQLFGSERAMRVWVDPNRLTSFRVSMTDVTDAIVRQNVQIAPGRVGDSPAVPGQRVSVPLVVNGQLENADAFRKIVIRANPDGSKLLLADVARVELGAQSLAFGMRENGHEATAAGVQLAPGANAVRTAALIEQRVAELQKGMPEGIVASIPFDTSPFVRISIEKVTHTLVEAMVLVFLVMLVFLQNIRYTLIPAIVVPIALLGTFTVMLLAGFSINVLTMFGMVLAIGIIVDDAIVVVEGVERIMVQEGLSPKEATSKAMRELTGAIVGITLVLTAVFIPMALAGGSVGAIYRQFTMAMAVSILFSAFLALTLTPALCATLLKPVASHAPRRGFFGWFNRRFDAMGSRYQRGLGTTVRRARSVMAAFVVVIVLLMAGFHALPSSFLPEEDQGYFMASLQLPSDATTERTLDTLGTFERQLMADPAVDIVDSVLGFSFSGNGANTAMAFVMLKDWKDRTGTTAQAQVAKAQALLDEATEGTSMALMPPAIDDLGTSSGFSFRLVDRAAQGFPALLAAQAKLLEATAGNPMFGAVYPDGLPTGTSVRLDIDREKARALSVDFGEISQTITAAMGSLYVNDFPTRGRMQQVIVQADAPYRMQVEDVMKLYVRNDRGGMVALSELVTAHWDELPLQMVRFQGYPALRLSGTPGAGRATGQAMDELEALAAGLPKGFGIEWTGQSLQERQSASQAPALMALSMLVVFLVLAALYESWSIPVAVILVVPLGLIGAVAAVWFRDMPNDVFFKVGLITVIGLSAKNAILIVEFAKQLHAEGMDVTQACIEAARLRLRPILMTSLAFALGVVPLMLATGASKETQQAIGTGVFGGMLTATLLAVFYVPLFYLLVTRATERLRAWRGARDTATRRLR